MREYDYSQQGMYFVTIVTQQRRCLLGNIVAGQVELSGAGTIAGEMLGKLPSCFPNVAIDTVVVMPNHIHAILSVGAQFIAPAAVQYENPGAMNRAPTLGNIVRAFKAATTYRIRPAGNLNFGWQRNYYEHVIRNEASLNRIRQYILDNPIRWESDPENPQATNPEPAETWRVP